jgi:hypothetical protein
MSVHDGNDFNTRDRRVSWSDVWAGLAVMLCVAAISAAVLVAEGSLTSPSADLQTGTPTFPLTGVQDPGRAGWRSTNNALDPGSHAVAPNQTRSSTRKLAGTNDAFADGTSD